MIPDGLVRVVASMVFVMGGAVSALGLLLIGEWCIWHIRERMGKYKRLHAYIKAHKKGRGKVKKYVDKKGGRHKRLIPFKNAQEAEDLRRIWCNKYAPALEPVATPTKEAKKSWPRRDV